MIIDSDGHVFETEEVFESYLEPNLRNYRPRLLSDDQGYNFWVVDGQTSYKRPVVKGAGAPGTAAPPGKKIQAARRASVGSQTLTNIKERLDDLDTEGIDIQFIYPSFLLHVNAWSDGILGMSVCRPYNTWDYPHADRTEGTARHLKLRDDLSERVRKKLLEDNARRFYDFHSK